MAGQKNRKLYHAALEEAKRADITLAQGTDPANALQWMVDRKMAQLLHAASEVDKLRPEDLTVMTAFGPVDHHWVRVENRTAADLSSLCVNMERVGLAERMVKVEEAKLALVNRAMAAALREIGVPQKKVAQLGPAFRRHLTLIQGGAEEAA